MEKGTYTDVDEVSYDKLMCPFSDVVQKTHSADSEHVGCSLMCVYCSRLSKDPLSEYGCKEIMKAQYN
jgi:hypothetical protein